MSIFVECLILAHQFPVPLFMGNLLHLQLQALAICSSSRFCVLEQNFINIESSTVGGQTEKCMLGSNMCMGQWSL